MLAEWFTDDDFSQCIYLTIYMLESDVKILSYDISMTFLISAIASNIYKGL